MPRQIGRKGLGKHILEPALVEREGQVLVLGRLNPANGGSQSTGQNFYVGATRDMGFPYSFFAPKRVDLQSGDTIRLSPVLGDFGGVHGYRTYTIKL